MADTATILLVEDDPAQRGLVASILLLIYCTIRREVLLGVVQLTNMASIVITIVLVRRSNTICAYHFLVAQQRAKGE